MSSSLSLYRKYRSPSFDELVGQEPVVRTLKNAIAAGRIAHAYLFTGPRGVGKTSAARLLARAANCLSEGLEKPCNQCANCQAAARDIATDLIEIDAASNTGVDNIREVIEKAQFAPSVWHTKFYVIDECHMLSVSAFNALLKTLEEPPPHTSFILATTEVHKVPATITSRCQRFDFRRIPLQVMTERLRYVCEQEGIHTDKEALELVARSATGSLRDALSLLDQLRVYAEGGISLQAVQEMLGASGGEEVASFADSIIAGDMGAGLRQIGRVVDEGLDLRQFNRQVVEHLRALMLYKTGAASMSDVALDVTEEMKKRLSEQAQQVTIPDLLRWIEAFAEADATLRSTAHRQLPLEMALVKAVLKPGEPAAAQLRVDRRAELAEAVEQVAATPKPRTREPVAADPPQPSVPPPIHSELGAGADHLLSGEEEASRAAPSEPIATNGAGSEVAHSPDGDLDRLVKLWPAVVDQIKARSRGMAAVFRDPNMVKPVQVTNGVCTIGFRDPIHARRSQEALQRELVETVLTRVLGHPCRLESVTFAELEGNVGNGDKPGSRETNSVKEKQPSPYETTRGKAAMNIFGITQFDNE